MLALSTDGGWRVRWFNLPPNSGVALRLPPQIQNCHPLHFLPCLPEKIAWPLAPEHAGLAFVALTLSRRTHLFASAPASGGKARLAVLHRGLLKVATNFGWQLEAWAVFSESLPLRRPLSSKIKTRQKICPECLAYCTKRLPRYGSINSTMPRPVKSGTITGKHGSLTRNHIWRDSTTCIKTR